MLWATSIWYLNDQREFALALDIAERVLEERKSRLVSRFDRGVLEVLREAVSQARDASVFVASFSENGDQLSQWRGYCPSSNGYSLGFRTSDLRKLSRAEQSFVLFPCLYDEDSQSGLVEQVIDAVFASANTIWVQEPDNSQRIFRQAFQEFGALLALVSPIIKDRSFQEEAEWRLVSLPRTIDRTEWRLVSLPRTIDRTEWQFRAGPSSLIPYYPVTLADANHEFKLDSVVVGPTPNPGLAASALESAALTKAVTIREIPSSSIPFRDW